MSENASLDLETYTTRNAFLSSSIPAMVHADDGSIIELNEAFTATTGYTQSEVTTVALLAQHIFSEKSACPILTETTTTLAGITAYRNGQARVLCKNGLSRTWDFCSIPLGTDSSGRHLTLSIAIDLTDHGSENNEPELTTYVLATLELCNRVLTHAVSEQQFVQDVCNILTGEGKYRRAWIGYLTNSQEKVLRIEACCDSEFGILYPVSPLWPNDPSSLEHAARAAQEHRHIVLSDPASDSAQSQKDNRNSPDSGSIAYFPLSVGGEASAVLCISSNSTSGFRPGEIDLLRGLASGLATNIEVLRTRESNAIVSENLLHANELLKQRVHDLVLVLGRVVETRDPYLNGHQERTAKLAVALAREMRITEDMVSLIEMAALLHDVGKLAVPAEILNKPDDLTNEEFALVRTHCKAGYDILKDANLPQPIPDIILQHHERINGSGYPSGLKDDDILLGARILAVADVIDAMSSSRSYRPVLGIDGILDELYSGGYDEDVVCAAERLYGLYGITTAPAGSAVIY